ncbi:MAG: formate--tetrahydrofolate ligase [Planctomycetaceae bacterium]|nr:formate--tetrahydrofolate ligase [Planctomycetaceae bacterium]
MNVPSGSPSPRPIFEIRDALGLGAEDVEPCGWFKGKLAHGLVGRLPAPRARYVDVTAVNPTPLGEGKTVTAIGLAMGLCRLGPKAIVTLRQPSLAPVFGVKGGGAGGGRSTLLPSDDINLHFTGDLHAVSAAHNLLAALLDNHARRGLAPALVPSSMTWRRVVDICDAGLAHIVTGLGNVPQAPLRETGFDLTAASEVMAILSLATSLGDLRRRVGRIVVGETTEGRVVTAEEIGAAGAMAALLREAFRPNLVQTSEHTPALVHTGPFGNIAHGNSSVIADLAAMRLADYVVTESGFGSDCGAEKFIDIKCRVSGLRPDCEVLVCTVRAMKYQSGRFAVRPGRPLPESLLLEDLDALRAGADNLRAHIEILRRFGLPVVVAVNRFPDDSPREIDALREIAWSAGATAAVSDAFARGGEGTIELAKAVQEACRQPNQFRFLYPLEMAPEEKIVTVARDVYGADGVDFEPAARKRLETFVLQGYGSLPVCIAKTQYSLSHDPRLSGRPRGFRLPIHDVRLSAGAGFLYALAGEIKTMPGLSSDPAARHIDLGPDGEIFGLR